jgi:hypothetical protein
MVYDKELNSMLKVIDDNSEYYQREDVIQHFTDSKLAILETYAQSILLDLGKNKNNKLTNELFTILEKLLLILEKLAFVFDIQLTPYLKLLLRSVYRLDTHAGRSECINNINELTNAQLNFNNLESKVLEFMFTLDNHNTRMLSEQLKHSKVANRYYTGHGFFTEISVNKDNCAPVSGTTVVASPHINEQSMGHGGGFVLFLQDGYLDCLEGYSYTDEWPISIDTFTLTSESWQTSKCPNRKST